MRIKSHEACDLPYADSVISNKVTMATISARSRIYCGIECITLLGCGGFNYHVISTGHVECELKQGVTMAANTETRQDWLYYERTGKNFKNDLIY